MITLGDLVFRCVVCLIVLFFFRFLFDVLGVLKRLGRQKADRQRAAGQRAAGQRAAGQKVDVVESDGKDQTVSFEIARQTEAFSNEADALEANPTCVDKDAYVVYRVNLFTGKYRFPKNRQVC
jgi:hypothetical protein